MAIGFSFVPGCGEPCGNFAFALRMSDDASNIGFTTWKRRSASGPHMPSGASSKLINPIDQA